MITPHTEEELAEAIVSAEGPLAIRGGATRGLPTEGTPLTTNGLSGITLYEPGALTLVAKSGTPVAEIDAALAAENQMLSFEPFDLAGVTRTDGVSTVGGVIASNASGSRRVQAGAARDVLLGVRFVDGRGDIIKNGGRVMKNVTGYDLARLMCGARGTLGVLTEVSLKVLPRPEATATLFLHHLSDDDAVARNPIISEEGHGSGHVIAIRRQWCGAFTSLHRGRADDNDPARGLYGFGCLSRGKASRTAGILR